MFDSTTKTPPPGGAVASGARIGVREVRALAADVRAVCGRFDPDALHVGEVDQVARALTEMRKLIGGAETRLARRRSDSGAWKQRGRPSPASDAAEQGGISKAKAKAREQTSGRLGEQPVLDDALRTGDVSEDQAELISQAAAADPTSEGRLVELAKTSTVGELREECNRVRAAADPDPEATRRRHHRNRSCRRRDLGDGSGEIRAVGPNDEIALIWAVVAAAADRVFEQARRRGEREALDAYAFDALKAIAQFAASQAAAAARSTGPAAADDPEDADDATATPAPDAADAEPSKPGRDGSAGSASRSTTGVPPLPGLVPDDLVGLVPAEVIVRLDLDAWIRGWPSTGEVCEIAGVGPVPVSAVEAMLRSGNAFLSTILTRGREVAGVVRHGRRPNVDQMTALRWLRRTCVTEGCDRPDVEVHHEAPWAETKVTLFDLLTQPCTHCHRLITHDGWDYAVGSTTLDRTRRLVPPDHPRHPRHHPGARRTPTRPRAGPHEPTAASPARDGPTLFDPS